MDITVINGLEIFSCFLSFLFTPFYEMGTDHSFQQSESPLPKDTLYQIQIIPSVNRRSSDEMWSEKLTWDWAQLTLKVVKYLYMYFYFHWIKTVFVVWYCRLCENKFVFRIITKKEKQKYEYVQSVSKANANFCFISAIQVTINQDHLQGVHHQRNYENKDCLHLKRRKSTKNVVRRRSGEFRFRVTCIIIL